MKKIILAFCFLALLYSPAWAIPPFPPSTASMTYPGSGIPKSTGSAWDTSISASANVYTFLGAADYAAMRTQLGLVIGTNVQAYSAALLSLAGLTETNGGIPYGTADNAYAWLAAGAANTVLIGNGAAAPSFSAFTLAAPGAANALLGSDGTNWTRVTSISLDDSAAQFYNTAAPTKLIRMDASGLTAGETAVIKPVGAYTLTYTLTGATGVTFPTTGTLSTLAGAETLSNKTLTAPISTLPVVNGRVTGGLSAANVSGTLITNQGMGGTAVDLTLPAAASGYNFIALATAGSAAAWKFTAATSPAPDDFICLDGTCGKTYVQMATPTQGGMLTCATALMADDGPNGTQALAQGSTTTAVANGAFTFDINGTGYSKAADLVGVAPGNDVIPDDTWGCVAFDIGVDGTLHAMEAAANATGYGSLVLAQAGCDAVALTDANHIRIGNVIATNTGGTFTFGTDNLATAGTTTITFVNKATYTPVYNWVCVTGAGVWTTN